MRCAGLPVLLTGSPFNYADCLIRLSDFLALHCAGAAGGRGRQAPHGAGGSCGPQVPQAVIGEPTKQSAKMSGAPVRQPAPTRE